MTQRIARLRNDRAGDERSVLVDTEQFDEVRQHEWSDERADESEQPNAREGSDERHHWVNPGDAPVDERANEVVEVRRKPRSDRREEQCRAGPMTEEQDNDAGQPNDGAPEEREHRDAGRDESPEHGRVQANDRERASDERALQHRGEHGAEQQRVGDRREARNEEIGDVVRNGQEPFDARPQRRGVEQQIVEAE